jgi:hypothetical protein
MAKIKIPPATWNASLCPSFALPKMAHAAAAANRTSLHIIERVKNIASTPWSSSQNICHIDISTINPIVA